MQANPDKFQFIILVNLGIGIMAEPLRCLCKYSFKEHVGYRKQKGRWGHRCFGPSVAMFRYNSKMCILEAFCTVLI